MDVYERYIEHLHDGHGHYVDVRSNNWLLGYLNIQIQEVEGKQGYGTGLTTRDLQLPNKPTEPACDRSNSPILGATNQDQP